MTETRNPVPVCMVITIEASSGGEAATVRVSVCERAGLWGVDLEILCESGARNAFLNPAEAYALADIVKRSADAPLQLRVLGS
jgi:hypothetical protein